MMLDKKQIWAISYPSSKWVVKHQRQLTTSATHLAQELLTNIQCSSSSRSSAKEKRAFKMGSRVAGHQKLVMTNLRAIIAADPLMTTWEVAEELNINHSVVVQHLKQTGKVKKLDKWVPQELTTNQKTHHFEVSSSLILLSNHKPFLYRIVSWNRK